MKPIIYAAVAAWVVSFVSTDFAMANGPGWSPVVVARGEYRDQIKSLPMEQRPYRPLHFYGNTVRRMHYYGSVTPVPRDVMAPNVVSGSRLFGR